MFFLLTIKNKEDRMKIWKKIKEFFGLHYEPSRKAKILLAILPFLLTGYLYLSETEYRHFLNPKDKLMPLPTQMYEYTRDYVSRIDDRTGQNLFLEDLKISLKRFGLGVGIFSSTALLLGVLLGVFPWLRTTFTPILIFISIIPPLAILPIIFITLGVEETGKVSLIVIGCLFLMTRDINRIALEIPREQTVKALTLGASSFDIICKIITPQVMPKFLETVRIYLSPAWLFLIAAEYTAASSGLACRIFLEKRYMNMALIIPIVLFITLLGYLFNVGLKLLIKWRYPWYELSNK